MRSTFNILFYINRSKLKTDGTTAILCRITIDGSKVVMSTGESISPQDWNVKRQETSDKKLNQRLQSFREKIEQGYNTLLLQFGSVSAELLKNHLQGVGSNPTTLLALSREELSIKVAVAIIGSWNYLWRVREKKIFLLRPLPWSFSMIIVSISSEKAMPYRQQNKLSFG